MFIIRYSILIYFFFQTGDFVHTIGDAHVYLNHIEPLKEQVDFMLHDHFICIDIQGFRHGSPDPSTRREDISPCWRGK